MAKGGFRLRVRTVALAVAALFAILILFSVLLDLTGPKAPVPLETMFSYPSEPPLGKLPEGVRPLRYALDLRIVPEEEHFSGTATIEVALDLHTDFIWLHGRGLNVARIVARKPNGQTLEATWEQATEGGVAKVGFEEQLKPGTINLQIEYDAPWSKNADGLYKVVADGQPMVFSQFQSIDARRAFPVFDEPRFKTPYDVSVIAPTGHNVITNASRIDLMPVGDGESLHLFETTQKLAPGIVALAVGAFDIVEGETVPPGEYRQNAIPLRGFARKGRGAELASMMAATAPFILWFEDYFKQPYPYSKLDLVAVPDFAWAGMENAAAIFYREEYLLVNEDTSPGDFIDIADTHAHELAHQWFGNLVTPQWWDDVWLNESFASWIAGKAIANWDPTLDADDLVKRYAHGVMTQDARPSAPAVRQPIEDNDDILGAFTDVTYFKGGGVLEMFESYVGDEDFREGVAMYMKRHRDGSATLDDFLAALSVGSRHPEIEPSLRSYLSQPGLPNVEVSVDCSGSIKEISFMQSRYFSSGAPAQDQTFWEIPICYRSDRGEGCHLLKEKRATIKVGKSCPAWVMPNRAGSGYYLWSLDADALGRLGKNLRKLTPIESEVLAFQLLFWMKSERISAVQALDLMKALAKLSRPRTDIAITDTLSKMRVWLSGDDLEALDEWINALYAERAMGLGFNPGKKEDPARSILRDRLTVQLIAETGEPLIRQRLLKALEKQGLSIGDGARSIAGILDHNRANAVLALGVLETGKSFTDILNDLLRSGGAEDKDHQILAALARTENKALGRRLMDDYLLTDKLRSEAIFTLAAKLAQNSEQMDGFWAWIGRSDNLDQLLDRTPEAFRYEYVTYGAFICDGSLRDHFVDVVGSRLDDIPGGGPEYARSLEAIDECLVVKERFGPELAAVL